MDAYALTSEKVSPFFGSIDEIVLAIAEHVPGLGLPPPEFDIETALVLPSSSQPILYYKLYCVHSRRSFSNPQAVSTLVRDTLKQHHLVTDDITMTESLGSSRSADSASKAHPSGYSAGQSTCIYWYIG
jgi:hypothetical protein